MLSQHGDSRPTKADPKQGVTSPEGIGSKAEKAVSWKASQI
jgi:hypothetical protein